MLRRLVVLSLLLGFQVALTAGSAGAEPSCSSGTTPVPGPDRGVICVPARDPGTPEEAVPQGAASHQTERPTGCSNADGEKVACSTSLGVWWSGHECYAEPYGAPPGSPAWRGHNDGTLWMCTSCEDAGNSTTCQAQVVWIAPGQAPGPPDPGQLASEAVGLLRLPPAEVHTAPQAPDHTYIGIENWLWVPQSQWATLSKTVTAGATSVTVTARPSQVRWDMGPASQTCYAAGTEWRLGMTDAAQTNCGYTYSTTSDSEPHGRFSISATISFQVDWTCTGACSDNSGTLGLVDAPAGLGSLQVLQRQTVVVQ